MSSATSATTPRSCVISMTAESNSACRSRIRSRICACTVTSSAVVGSSAISRSGSFASAIAIIARCRMPPEKLCGWSSTRDDGCGMPTRPSRSIGVRAGLLLRRVGVVQPVGLDDLVAHRVEGVQGGQRVLEDHRHPPAAQAAHPLRVRPDELLAAEPDLAGDLRVPVQPHDREAAHALARAGLPHDSQPGAAFEGERQPVDGLDHAVVGGEPDAQVADVEEGPRHRVRTRGSTTA